MKIANPNDAKPYDKVYKDQFGQEKYATRQVEDGEEIIDLRTGKSSHSYYSPDIVLDPSNCPGHKFHVIDTAKREIECTNCFYQTSLNLGTNHKIVNGRDVVIIRQIEYFL